MAAHDANEHLHRNLFSPFLFLALTILPPFARTTCAYTGRELWVLLISKNPETEVLLKPNVKYIANMHGNEVSLYLPRCIWPRYRISQTDANSAALLPTCYCFTLQAVGRELMLHLIDYLLTSYSTDQYVTYLLDNTRIHLMPSMNPDGFELATEGECAGGRGRLVC